MKSCLCIFMITLFAMSFGFSEVNLFSLIELDDFINVEKMISMSDSWYFSDFEKDSKKHLRNVNVNIHRIDNQENHILFYNSKGLLEKEESKVYEDYDFICKYDEKDRLLSCGNFTFKYIDDLQRERYCREQLQFREILKFQNEKLIITVISYSKRNDDGTIFESGKRIYEYSFDNKFLTDICCTSFNRNGIEKKKKNYMKLFYDNDRIIKIQEYYGDELRIEQSFTYQNNNLVKRSVNYPADAVANYTAEYSDFDEYGNFLNYVERTASGIKVSLSREIKYIE